MVLKHRLADFFQKNPRVRIESTNDEGFVDVVERGFDAGIRLGESVQQDMAAVPLGRPVTMAVVDSPDDFERIPAPLHPNDLVHHNCVRFWGSGSKTIYGRELGIDGRPVAYEVQRSLTISDSLFGIDAVLEGVGLACTIEASTVPFVEAKRSSHVSIEFFRTFPGVYPYHPSRHDQPTTLKALIEFIGRSTN